MRLGLVLFGSTAYPFWMDGPAQQDLRFAYVVLFGHDLERGVRLLAVGLHLVRLGAVLPIGDSPGGERNYAAVGDGCDRVVVEVSNQLGFLRPRMELDLVGNRHGQARCLRFLDVLDAEVAHADRARLSLPLQLDEPASLGESLVAFKRRMDQVKVHVVYPQPFEALAERCHRGLGGLRRLPPNRVPRPELRGNEELASRQALGRERQLDSRPDARFILIALGGVDVPVAGANGLTHRCGNLIVCDEVRAKAKVRDFDICGQCSGNRSQSGNRPCRSARGSAFS